MGTGALVAFIVLVSAIRLSVGNCSGIGEKKKEPVERILSL